MDAIMTILMYAVICLFVGLVLYHVIKKAVKERDNRSKSCRKRQIVQQRNRRLTHFKPGFIACNRKKCYC